MSAPGPPERPSTGQAMIARFCAYSVLKNIRPFAPFFVLYLILDPQAGGLGLDLFRAGLVVGWERVLVALLEVPLGIVADRFGRRRSLAACFAAYALAFSAFAVAATRPAPVALMILLGGQTLYAVGEAFRTGTHKAIMLDWIDTTARTDGTRIVALARSFSKVTEGVTALAGGILLFARGDLSLLFSVSVVPALAGVALSLSYPRWLEGDMVRDRSAAAAGVRAGLRRLASTPALVGAIGLSVVFEACFKVAQHYIQPLFRRGFDANDVAIVGDRGALWLGGFYLLYGFVGAVGSSLAGRAEHALGGRRFAFGVAFGGGALVCAGLAFAQVGAPLAVSAAGFVLLALLQNARRPVFVSFLNRLMDRTQRATTLSIESQGRSIAVALLAPLSGWVGDRWGLDAVFWLLAALLLAAGLAATRGMRGGSGG